MLAGWTAVTGWALLQHARTTVHIVPGGRRGTTARGVCIHRTTLSDADRAEHDGFPLTSVARTIVDVAGEATDHQLGAMLDTALRNGLYDRSEMAAAVDRAFGLPGVGRLVALLGKLGDDGELLRSTTERKVRDRLVAAGVPRALVNVPVAKGDGTHYELDLLWPRIGLNVEIDGPQHRLPFQAAADAARDAWLTARRFRVVRFPVERIDGEFPSVLAEIRALVGP